MSEPQWSVPSGGASEPPGRDRRSRWRIRALQVAGGAIGVTLVLFLGTGAYTRVWERVTLLLDPGRGLPVAGQLSGDVLWRADRPGPSRAQSQLIGSWLSGQVLVWGGYHRLVGYDVGTGETRWELAAPQERRFCGMSPQVTDEGLGVVMVDRRVEVTDDDHEVRFCDEVMLVEVATGETRWSAPVGRYGQRQDALQPLVVADTVLVPQGGRPYALAVADGEEPWWLTGGWLEDADQDDCRIEALPSGRRHLAAVYGRCVLDDGTRRFFLAAVDTAEGRPAWVEYLTDDMVGDLHLDDVYLAAADPLTLLDRSTAGGATGGWVFDDTGQPQRRVPGSGTRGSYQLTQRYIDGPLSGPTAVPTGSTALIQDRVLYAATESDHDADDPNGMAAVDLTTGEELWARPVPNRQVLPVAVDGNQLLGIGHEETGQQEGGRYEVVAFDLARSGAPELLGPSYLLPHPLGPEWGHSHWAGDRMALLSPGGGEAGSAATVTVLG